MNIKKSGSGFRRLISLKDYIIPVLVFVLFFGFFFYGLDVTDREKAKDELATAESNIRKAVVSCYAIEGRYPESYEYIRKNYGVHIDENKYYVHYEVFASNIMPEITVVLRREQVQI